VPRAPSVPVATSVRYPRGSARARARPSRLPVRRTRSSVARGNRRAGCRGGPSGRAAARASGNGCAWVVPRGHGREYLEHRAPGPVGRVDARRARERKDGTFSAERTGAGPAAQGCGVPTDDGCLRLAERYPHHVPQPLRRERGESLSVRTLVFGHCVALPLLSLRPHFQVRDHRHQSGESKWQRVARRNAAVPDKCRGLARVARPRLRPRVAHANPRRELIRAEERRMLWGEGHRRIRWDAKRLGRAARQGRVADRARSRGET